MRRIREVPVDLDPSTPTRPKIFINDEWRQAYPWLVQGITGASFDLRLFGSAPAGDVMDRWDLLRASVGFERALHARQVHGNRVARHGANGDAGLNVLADTDGHATEEPGVLLTVAVADCVPVSLVDPDGKRVALVHAGWRGIVAGILDSGVAELVEMGSAVQRLSVHLGPHICDECYEVGPEVHEALGGAIPAGPQPVSLAGALERRALSLGIGSDQITASTLCTRCDTDLFYSHRGGATGRQVALIGVRAS